MQTSQDVVPAGHEALPVAIDGARGEPHLPAAVVDGDHLVVQAKAQLRQPLIDGGQGREVLQPAAKIVTKEAHQAPAEGHGEGTARRRVHPGEEPASVGERIRPVAGRLEHLQRVGGEVAPPRPTSRAGTLQEGQAGPCAEALGQVEGRHARQVGQRCQQGQLPVRRCAVGDRRGDDHRFA